jgi:hypothetical protein
MRARFRSRRRRRRNRWLQLVRTPLSPLILSSSEAELFAPSSQRSNLPPPPPLSPLSSNRRWASPSSGPFRTRPVYRRRSRVRLGVSSALLAASVTVAPSTVSVPSVSTTSVASALSPSSGRIRHRTTSPISTRRSLKPSTHTTRSFSRRGRRRVSPPSSKPS